MKLNYFLLLLLGIMVCSCSVTRFIPEDETLYEGATFNLEAKEELSDYSTVEQELQAVLRPQPNSSKIGLYAHYKVTKDSAGFFYKFINKRIEFYILENVDE